MPYTAAELELITIVDSLIGQSSLAEQTKLLIEGFPPSLSRAKDYFLHYMEYVALRNKYFEKDASLEQKKAYEAQLKQLESTIDRDFKPHNKQEKELIQYLELHFNSRWQFNDNNHLIFKAMNKPNEYWINLDNQMQQLAINFAPVLLLQVKLPPSTRKSQRDAYKNGAKAGNLECKIKLADMYLNARIQNLTKKKIAKLDITEQEAIDFIKEGVAKGMPSAIASMSIFVDNWLKAAPFLYATNDSSTEKHRTVLAKNGRLALALCSDAGIQNGINAILNLNNGVHTNNADAFHIAKEHKENILELVEPFAKTLQLSNDKASEMGRKLAAESVSSTMDIQYAMAYLHHQGLTSPWYDMRAPKDWTAEQTIKAIKPFLDQESYINTLHNAIHIFLERVISTNHTGFTQERLTLMKGLCELINPKNPKLEQGIQDIQGILTRKHNPQQREEMIEVLSNLQAENELTRNVALVTMNIDKQIKTYKTSDQNSAKNAALEDTKGHLTKIFSLDSVSEKTTIALKLMENLKSTTQELPTSNPLKRCINAVIKKLFNKDNFIKSQAYEIGQRGHKLLTQFNKHLEKPPAQPPKEAVVDHNLTVKPATTPKPRSPSSG